MNSFRDVIKQFGGAVTMASTLKNPSITDNLIRQWGYRDSIPASYWPEIIEKARERRMVGVTFAALAGLARPRKRAA